MQKILVLWATVKAFFLRRSVIVTASALTAAAMLAPVPANAATPLAITDPLGGAGTGLVDDLLEVFTTIVIPAVAGVILAVVAFKMIVKLGTRFFNRA